MKEDIEWLHRYAAKVSDEDIFATRVVIQREWKKMDMDTTSAVQNYSALDSIGFL